MERANKTMESITAFMDRNFKANSKKGKQATHADEEKEMQRGRGKGRTKQGQGGGKKRGRDGEGRDGEGRERKGGECEHETEKDRVGRRVLRVMARSTKAVFMA